MASIDFRSSKGGISRLSNIISEALNIKEVYSLHGEYSRSGEIRFFNANRLKFLISVVKYIIIHKPSLIIFDHLNISRALIFVPSFLLKEVVIYLHDEEAWSRVEFFRRRSLHKATKILCNSEYTRNKFIASNPEFHLKTFTSHPGGVPEHFGLPLNVNSKYKAWINAPRPFILFVSRLWKVHRFKGYLELLEAYKAFASGGGNSHLRLAIIGSGDDEKTITDFIKKENLSDDISLFPDVDDESLKAFYQNSLCLFFPSTREGFGMVFLEAMYFRKACIGIKNQPAEEIIVDGVTGLLLENNKPETLSQTLTAISKDPGKIRNMGEEGHKRYTSYFNKEHFKKRLLTIINN